MVLIQFVLDEGERQLNCLASKDVDSDAMLVDCNSPLQSVCLSCNNQCNTVLQNLNRFQTLEIKSMIVQSSIMTNCLPM